MQESADVQFWLEDDPRDAPYRDFLAALPEADNETSVRELFVILASQGFADRSFATTLALGAEHSVAFQQHGLVRRGRVDSFVENALIEFKQKLTDPRQKEAAVDQLRNYIAGAWKEDGSYQRPYVAIATDGLSWHVYSSRPQDARLPPDQGASGNVILDSFDSWSAIETQNDPASLRRFLNRVLLRRELLHPTSDNFVRDFGPSGLVYLTIRDVLARKAEELQSSPQLQLYENSWKADLQVAYGHLDDTGDLFVRHTYLALFARLLVWSTLERRAAEPSDLQAIFDKTYFTSKRIGNLVEDDYFAWHLLPGETSLTTAWTALVAQLATYRLDEIAEDVLKPLYEELVDPEMRHDLGEYYTPDWLANDVVEHMVTSWNNEIEGIPRMLDPACGSGTFLRAAIDVIKRRQNPDADKAERLLEITENVHGMDVHPLAVIIARATYLLAVSELIVGAKSLVYFPVYLCNSLTGQEAPRASSLFGDLVEVEIGRGAEARRFQLPDQFVTDGARYDKVISEVVDIAKSVGLSHTAARRASDAVRFKFRKGLEDIDNYEVLVQSLASMAQFIAELAKRGEDSIYGFLLKNKYRSTLLRKHFDIIVGNPPWLTLADIESGDYRDLLLERNAELQVAPRSAGEQAHTEIATVFLVQCAAQYLRARDDVAVAPRLGFVMPRSVFSASHHRLFREASYRRRVDVVELWDLEQVVPLFNVPSCVIFAGLGEPRPYLLKRGKVFSGRLPSRDPSPRTANARLVVFEQSFELRYLGRRSAWAQASDATLPSSVRSELLSEMSSAKPQPYSRRFRQGAILYPQKLIIAEPVGDADGIVAGPVTVRHSRAAAASARLLREYQWQRIVDAENLFWTAAAEHILPYALRHPLWLAVLPTISTPADNEFGPVDADVLRSYGRISTADWLDEAEARWVSARRPREKMELWQRLDYLQHLTAQAGRKRFLVLYTASGTRAVSTVLDTQELNRPFVARDKTYWTATNNRNEAYFLSVFLNSDYVDNLISDFVTRGLFGRRDVHKRVLDVPWPDWDPDIASHRRVAALGEAFAEEARRLVPSMPEDVGRARTQLRSMLDLAQLHEAEQLVTEMSLAAARL
jgi:hypothetical protein